MSNKDKWVRRFSVNETAKHKNGFTIYKITSVLFPLDSPEAVTVVSVWKRYSDVQSLHKQMKALHSGLHLRGECPTLVRHGYFKRFQKEVIEERAKVIQTLLEFVAEHRLLFTSTDFVNFLQTGYPAPESPSGSVIASIRSSLHLPLDDAPPLEYDSSGDDSRTHSLNARPLQSIDETDYSQIPIYEPADVEIRHSPNCTLSADNRMSSDNRITNAGSFESLNSLDSISSDLYSELDKVAIPKTKSQVKRNVLPDLINFDVPSTSTFDDYHTMNKSSSVNNLVSGSVVSETISVNSVNLSDRSNSRMSIHSAMSLRDVERSKTEDSYVFEAGYMLNLAARYEDMREYARAFDCYKGGIEKMLIGVQLDTDPQRRALIKEKTNKYLSYAEDIYKNHLCDGDQCVSDRPSSVPVPARPVPLSMLRLPRTELAQYRVVAAGGGVLLVLHRGEQACYAMKVIQKIPNNLTEFDEYFLQNTKETRQPILPTLVPYMVTLHSYIETNDLVFLILSYAPGGKLFDYIKNYAKSVPTTPAREVNLENVFTEPKIKKNDLKNDNFENKKLEIDTELMIEDENISIIDRIEANIENCNQNNNQVHHDHDFDQHAKINETIDVQNAKENQSETDVEKLALSVNELVINSQKLLLNVDKALNEKPKIIENREVAVAKRMERDINTNIEIVVERNTETPPCVYQRSPPRPPRAPLPPLPPLSVRRWSAEIFTAIHHLHSCGVICRDLNPSNILLGESGQTILTYFTSCARDVFLSKLHSVRAEDALYIAPEYWRDVLLERYDDRVGDYWSFGAVLYQLECGVPLCASHSGVFTAHTVLRLPGGLPLDVRSVLTQLLTYEPSERIGAGKDGADEIKRHPYFKQIDWRDVRDSWSVPG